MKFKSRNKSDFSFLALLLVGFYLFLLIGYCRCVYKLCSSDFKAPYKAEVIYGVGTVTGLGVLIGWFDIQD